MGRKNGNVPNANTYENLNGDTLTLEVNKSPDWIEIRLKTKWKNIFLRKCALILIMCSLVLLGITYQTNVLTIISVICLLILFYNVSRIAQEESILVAEYLGYQIHTKYVIGHSDEFIEWDIVEGIFISEVISLQKVLFTLTILTKDCNKKLIPLFRDTKPRLDVLEKIYKLLSG